MKRIGLIVMVMMFTGCSNPGIVQIGPDTYMLGRDDHAGIFGNKHKLKASVIRDANEFAAKQGKVAIPVAARDNPMGNGPAQWASFEYQFRLVDPDHPDAKQWGSLDPVPDIVIQDDR